MGFLVIALGRDVAHTRCMRVRMLLEFELHN